MPYIDIQVFSKCRILRMGRLCFSKSGALHLGMVLDFLGVGGCLALESSKG